MNNNNKVLQRKERVFYILLIAFAFLGGIFVGVIMQQQIFYVGMTQVAEGLEGTIFNIEIDINETQIVDNIYDKFDWDNFDNETFAKEQLNEGDEE